MGEGGEGGRLIISWGSPRPPLAGLGSITIDDYDYGYDYMSFLFIDYDYVILIIDYDYDYMSSKFIDYDFDYTLYFSITIMITIT